MNKTLSHALLSLLCCVAAAAAVRAQTVSFTVGAGKLYGASGTALPAGNLVLLVADTAGDGFASFVAGHSLTIGSYLNNDDQILGRLFTDADSLAADYIANVPLAGNSTPGAFTALTAGDALGIVWFSSLTGISSVLTAGDAYGLFSNGSSPTDGDPWLVPGSGSISLNFTTIAADITGTHDETEAYANLTVAAVPEPATSAALAGLLTLGLAFCRRRGRA